MGIHIYFTNYPFLYKIYHNNLTLNYYVLLCITTGLCVAHFRTTQHESGIIFPLNVFMDLKRAHFKMIIVHVDF